MKRTGYGCMAPDNKNTSIPNKPGNPTPDKPEHRVFVNDRGEGTFICPACNKGVIRDLSDFSDLQSAVRLKCKCSCGKVYRVLVERRRHFRKPVNLVGKFIFQPSQGNAVKGLAKIRDISQSGMRFSVNNMPDFKVGDMLIIEFTLDDKEHSQTGRRASSNGSRPT